MATQIGIIHEIGDYSDVEPLNPKDQRKVQEQYERREEKQKSDKMVYRG